MSVDYYPDAAFKLAAVVGTLLLATTAAQALDTEEIGKLKANFGGEKIEQPTVRVKSGKDNSNTAFLFVQKVGISSLSLAGYRLDNKRLGIEVSYMSMKPGTKTAPMDLTITYAPKGDKGHWTSDGASTPAKITLTTFENNGKEGRAVGSFKAQLCYAKTLSSGADTQNCRPIEGSFDTKFFVEE